MNSLFPDLEPVPTADEGPDVAYTPDAVARACVRFLVGRNLLSGAYWEPCSGSGAWLPALDEYGPGFASELDPKAASVATGIAWQHDAAKGPLPQMVNVGCIVTNPPFSCAGILLRRWLEIPTVQTIVLLLRRDWIVPEGSEEKETYRLDLCWGPYAKIAMEVILYPRVPFGGPGRDEKGTDTREYSLFVWQRQTDGTWRAQSPLRAYRLDWRSGVVL